MQLENFALTISPGNEQADGYVDIGHNTKYSINLSNTSDCRCDAEVKIDGQLVGVWRVTSKGYITLERPVNDTGMFTFYKFDTPEAKKAGLSQDENLGLVSVLFKPEKVFERVENEVKFSRAKLGGTGLSGKSEQKFQGVTPLDYDEAKFMQIHLRLRCVVDEPRPLGAGSTPVPPPLTSEGSTIAGALRWISKKNGA